MRGIVSPFIVVNLHRTNARIARVWTVPCNAGIDEFVVTNHGAGIIVSVHNFVNIDRVIRFNVEMSISRGVCCSPRNRSRPRCCVLWLVPNKRGIRNAIWISWLTRERIRGNNSLGGIRDQPVPTAANIEKVSNDDDGLATCSREGLDRAVWI